MRTLSDAILNEDINAVQYALQYTQEINELDVYGFTPLIEAAIVDNVEISKLLLKHHALPNVQDVTGGTALHWAVENNNLTLCKLLLDNGADPNGYNLAGQPVLVMPLLRQHHHVKKLLIEHGADLRFAQDFINTKLLGHIFELTGNATIVSPANQFVEVDFEGFYLEVTLALISDSVRRFQHHYISRQWQRYSGISNFIVNVLARSIELIKYQQYRVDIRKYKQEINELIQQDPLIIPVGYEGHAITFIRYGNLWVKCDRREESRLYDNVMIYLVRNKNNMTTDFVKSLVFEKQSDEFINKHLDEILDLEPVTEIKVDAQISGNCSWANVEATIPALFFLVLMELSQNEGSQAHNKTLALNYFHRWRDWSKGQLLYYFVQAFEEGDVLRRASFAEMLVALLFQCCDENNPSDINRIETILNHILNSPYEYLLKNYLRIYYYESNTDEGKKFANMLKSYGFKV